jgi:hypothetical protein
MKKNRAHHTYSRTAKCELHNCHLVMGRCVACVAAEAESKRRARLVSSKKIEGSNV